MENLYKIALLKDWQIKTEILMEKIPSVNCTELSWWIFFFVIYTEEIIIKK
jgi:hypothetical protein